MSRNKECVAMLLAGGQGSRLYHLTTKMAKPAVPFGGKYRIIDFPLSNCVNSGIDTVGVLTQYQPLVLNEYIGNGQPWDLDRNFGGVHVLPPYQAKASSEWYKGTANAIYQNLHFMQVYNPEYIIILSGDHIYKMDYSLMLESHKAKNADCTIAVLEVPIEEASRFGIMSTDPDMRITQFEEKPKKPKNNLASMGIYIFTAKKLFENLALDDKKLGSSYDFGKDVIPDMLFKGDRMFAYRFSGYWKDVGTIDSLWQANMDLLGANPAFDIAEETWKIHSRSANVAPHYLGEKASAANSLISGGCEIYGSVKNCILGSGVVVEEGAVVEDAVIFAGVTVQKGARVEYSIVDEDAVIGKKAQVGEPKTSGHGIAVIGKGYAIGNNAVIPGGSMLEKQEAK